MAEIPKDLDTGLPLTEAAEQQFLSNLQAQSEEANKVRLMSETEGWKVMSEFLFQAINSSKEQLIDAVDPDHIKRLQAMAKAYSNVIGYVHEQIAKARMYQDMTKES